MPMGVALGCGADAGSENVGQVEERAVKCAAGPTVEGVDVSHYQGSIDWSAAKASGLAFAVASVGDGSYQDPTFATNWAGMKSAGLIRGAYQFFEPGEDPGMQADIIIGKVGKLGDGDLPCTLDVEVTGGQSAATIIANIHTWMSKVEAATGKKPMIYTGKYFWQDNVAGSADFTSSALWIAAYGVSCPNLPDGSWGDWKFWQYTDKASVGGISGGVDGDKFNGSLADLQAFAGGGADYAAQFVAQSWPYATMSFPLVTGEAKDAWIELRNVGKKTWDSKTMLGTTVARDRKSPFAGSDWVNDHRLAGVSGTVPPGSTFKFQFKWHAPSMPGSYDEHYSLVQEGVTWFGDQGGPADDVIEAKIDVTQAKYAAQFVSQSFPTADKVLALDVGQSVKGFIELKNVGTEAWKAGETKLAPTPRDKTSPLASNDWLSPTRISSPDADVPPGGSYKFPVTLTGNAAGDVMQTFGVVEDGIGWFSDPPNGGGPADDFLRVHAVVGGAFADAGVPTADAGPVAEAGLDLTASGDVNGSCSCRTAGSESSTKALWLLPLIGLVAARRRRSR